MSPRVRSALWMVVVALLAASAGLYLADRLIVPAPKADAAGKLLAMRLPDLAGRPQSLEQWRGKVMVVNFWATWCAPCRKEIPEFVQTSARYRERGVQFVGVSIDAADKVREYRDEAKIAYPLLIGDMDAMKVGDDLGNQIRALPFTVIVDRDGRIRLVKLGPLPQDQLERTLDAALASSAG